MSVDLDKQIKSLKITDATILWLRVTARTTGKTHAELAREALHERAIRDREEVSHKYKLYQRLCSGEEPSGDDSGNSVSIT